MKGISVYKVDEYQRLMSQKNKLSNEPHRPLLDSEVEHLVTKAREAAIHALDSYNRPGTIFRTEGFTVMMVIAWRSLFHAIFQRRGTEYFYRDDAGLPQIVDGEKRAWGLSTCVDNFYETSAINPIRKNLEFIIGLRNKIEHRFVPAIDAHVAGECQALILNFDNLLVKEFGEYYAIRDTLAIPLQTSGLRPDSQLEAMKQFQSKHYEDLKDYIETFRDSIPGIIYQDLRYSFRVYLIPKVGNHKESADLAYEFIKYDPDSPEDMAALRQVVLIKERQVPVVNAGTYKPSQVAKLVAAKTGRKFGPHQHILAWKMYDVRKSGNTPEGCKTQYCQFDQTHQDYVFTAEWVEFLVTKLLDEAEYIRLLSFKSGKKPVKP